jgi:hypothetical protein
MLLLFFLIVQIILIFFLSRLSTNQIFYFLRRFIKNEKIIFSFVSIFYLPGTALHEIAHFFAVTILFLKVKEVKIFPEFKKDYIKLGSVLYEKKDFVRGFLVGISPFFAALFFFYFISVFKLFPSSNFLQNFFFAYIIFVVSSTMFSSKQDLVDFVFIIPFIILVVGVLYIFQIDLNFILNDQKILNNLLNFLKEVNFYLFVSLILNASSIIILRLITTIVKK